jgi:hypothetical protein
MAQNSQYFDIFIHARASHVSSPLQAEAGAMLLAAKVASSLILQEPIFFTDSLGLARVIAAP